jgi:glycosyltransferase involved in cell wall biosynthesis
MAEIHSESDHRPIVLAVVRWPVGGIRTYLRDLFAAPALRDYAFVLIAPNEEKLDEYVANGQLGCRTWIAPGPSFLQMSCAVAAATRRLKPALVHSHGFMTSVISGLAQLTGFPHLLTVHDLVFDTQFQGHGGHMGRLVLGASLIPPHYIHCVTNDSRDNLLACYPWVPRLKHKTVVIPHGVDTAKIEKAPKRVLALELGWPPDTVIFGFLGRFMAQKGFNVLVDAIGILRQHHDLTPARARVLAVGSGGYVREERARIGRLGLEEFFTFWPQQAEIASILKGIHCLVMPSLWEASGLLAMEAMVAGTPVIGTDCVGLRETLAASPSVQVGTNDAVQLSEALARFLARPDRQAATEFQPQASQRFSGDRSFAALRDLYKRVR